MAVLAFNFTHGPHPVVRKFSDQKTAITWRNDWFIPNGFEGLAKDPKSAPTEKMLELITLLDPSQPIELLMKGTRSEIANQLFGVAEDNLNITDEGIDPMTDTAVASKKDAAKNVAAKKPAKAPTSAPAAKGKKPTPPAAGKGRTSNHAGKVLTYSGPVGEDKKPVNPRREGSHGYNSLAIIIKAGKEGIAYEAYIKAGGRPNDLAWDIDHGNVKAK